jgi:hypothetical protein
MRGASESRPSLRNARRSRRGLVVVFEAHTASDGIMDHKPVLVAWSQADKMRQSITKLCDFFKAGCNYYYTGRQLDS